MSDKWSDTLPVTLTSRDAAKLLGVSESTFWNYRKLGFLKGCEARIPGRWSREAIVALAHGRQPRTRKSA